jgi:tRNA pseudouridine55 synthase
MSSQPNPSGFLNIDKPLGMTSHDVVARVRRALNTKKVGHAGTLDPLATGVLIVCVGTATRLSEYVMHTTKRYTARVRLGQTTTTYDAEGELTEEHDAGHVTQAMVEAALPQFLGDIQQRPPIYSAIKKGGRKLYEMARSGIDVEIEARPVHIDALVVSSFASPEFDLDVTCGAGTYIRSLAHDLGEALGVGAHLRGLVRTSSGSFSLDDAVSLENFSNDRDPSRWLLPIDTALVGWPVVQLTDQQVDDVLHGRYVPAPEVPADNLARGVSPDGQTIAILIATGTYWKPHKVLLR